MPKLNGQLNLIAYKDGKKVYDKQVDFDTIDLLVLTKRFNTEKNNIYHYQKWFLMDLTNLVIFQFIGQKIQENRLGCSLLS